MDTNAQGNKKHDDDVVVRNVDTVAANMSNHTMKTTCIVHSQPDWDTHVGNLVQYWLFTWVEAPLSCIL